MYRLHIITSEKINGQKIQVKGLLRSESIAISLYCHFKAPLFDFTINYFVIQLELLRQFRRIECINSTAFNHIFNIKMQCLVSIKYMIPYERFARWRDTTYICVCTIL